MPDVDKQTAVDEVIAKLGLNPVRSYLPVESYGVWCDAICTSHAVRYGRCATR